ncbi:MAG: DUF1858 domain-containing protein [Nanoarchaeota archaeon]
MKNKKSKKKIALGEKITPKTKLSKIMEINPKAGEILFESGMHCIGCAMAGDENLEEGCKAHGMDKKQIIELIKRLNE